MKVMGIYLFKELKQFVPEDRLSTNETILENHSKDESFHPACRPDIVVFPKNTDEIVKIVRFANQNEIPIVPFGIGSGLEGQVIPLKGGISIDFQLMNKIIEINPHDLLVRVEPGVTRKQLNKELGKYGLFFSVDPGADASLGGMAATNASGTTAVRYGTMKENVRNLKVVLADGKVIDTGGKAKKSSSGYHLTELFVGSEGTLGVFTELTLQVFGISETIMAARAVFPSVRQACEAAVSLLRIGVPIARVELVDDRSMKQINIATGSNYKEQVTLFLEFHGSKVSVENDVHITKEMFLGYGCQQFEFESDSNGRLRLWDARHNLFYAYLHSNPGKKMMNTDVCVPLSKLGDAIEKSRDFIEQSGLTGTVVGHIGDGNFHAGLILDPKNPIDMERANWVNEQIVDFALIQGGTCTGEHGVGLGKMKYQRREHGEGLEIMKNIKKVLDPKGILNPGKIFS
ncbi:FAD-binding oxidoreductase [Neobacillus sp. SAB-20_R2A]|uniref:FAD-binding oxidoreductase n=1 Tax=Neobacillus sp. SAB-20_R2A TaxID=3120519 RepID=UPI003C6E8CA0